MKTKRYLLIFIIIASIFLPKLWLIYISPLFAVTVILIEKKSVKMIKNKTILILFVLLVLLQPILLGEKDITFYLINISSHTFISGLSMFIRAIFIITTFQILNRTVPKEKLFGFWKIIGVTDFNEAFDVTRSLFPKLKERMISVVNQKRKFSILKSPLTVIAEIIALTMNEAHSSGIQNSRGNEL